MQEIGGIDAAMDRAAEQRVTQLVTICCDLPEEAWLFRNCLKYPGRLFCTLGVHPHWSDGSGEQTGAEITAALLEGASRAPRGALVALGECGLDFFKSRASADVQKRVFKAHLEACVALDLPVVIHCRDADDVMIEVLKGFAATASRPLRGVLHCFDGSERLAAEGLALGLYVSCSGIITFRQKEKSPLRHVFGSIVPDDRLLIETDAPFLTPAPMRGKVNEPAMVRHTATALAKLRGVEVRELAAVTARNARSLFRLPPPPPSS